MQLIYKYASFTQHTEELLSTPQLWFSHPSNLNDPFECHPWYKFDYQPHQLVERFARHLRRVNPRMTPHMATAEATSIFLAGGHRDPQMWTNVRNDLADGLRNRASLLCLSRSPDSILMWSHYGKDHKGFCLGFEWSAYTDFFGRALKVKYRKNLPVVDVFNSSVDLQVAQILLTKYVDWTYEREWRIIEHESKEGLRAYPESLLKTLTFGLNASAQDKANAQRWAAKRSHPVQLFECVRDERQFKIHIQPLPL